MGSPTLFVVGGDVLVAVDHWQRCRWPVVADVAVDRSLQRWSNSETASILQRMSEVLKSVRSLDSSLVLLEEGWG